MLQILNGLDYLHKNNILFRDIKLENILFDLEGKIKITDFGLSKPDIDEDEITYSYCGSPEYMAPEMLTKYIVCYSGRGIPTRSIFTHSEYCSINCSSAAPPSTPPKRSKYFRPFCTRSPSSPDLPLPARR